MTQGASSGDAGSGTLSESISVQQRLKALTVITSAGKQTPRLEGNPLTNESIEVFIKDCDEYCCDQMRWSMRGEIPRKLVGVLDLMGCSHRKVIRDAHNNEIELSDQSCTTALKKMAGLIERETIDERSWVMK